MDSHKNTIVREFHLPIYEESYLVWAHDPTSSVVLLVLAPSAYEAALAWGAGGHGFEGRCFGSTCCFSLTTGCISPSPKDGGHQPLAGRKPLYGRVRRPLYFELPQREGTVHNKLLKE